MENGQRREGELTERLDDFESSYRTFILLQFKGW